MNGSQTQSGQRLRYQRARRRDYGRFWKIGHCRGEAFVNWFDVIENAEATYGWTDANVLSVVRSKGGPKIAK